jgi:hypothetical protein
MNFIINKYSSYLKILKNSELLQRLEEFYHFYQVLFTFL